MACERSWRALDGERREAARRPWSSLVATARGRRWRSRCDGCGGSGRNVSWLAIARRRCCLEWRCLWPLAGGCCRCWFLVWRAAAGGRGPTNQGDEPQEATLFRNRSGSLDLLYQVGGVAGQRVLPVLVFGESVCCCSAMQLVLLVVAVVLEVRVVLVVFQCRPMPLPGTGAAGCVAACLTVPAAAAHVRTFVY